jgi:hypothetical protein
MMTRPLRRYGLSLSGLATSRPPANSSEANVVFDDFSESGILAPGSYRLNGAAVSGSETFEDASTANGAGYSFAIVVPEPASEMLSAAALMTIGLFARVYRTSGDEGG